MSKFYICSYICRALICYTLFSSADAYNATGQLLPVQAHTATQVTVAILETILISFITLIGVFSTILANQSISDVRSNKGIVERSTTQYGHMARATLALPTIAFLVAFLLSSAMHSPTLWTAANIIIGLSVIGVSYIYQAMVQLHNRASDISIIRGCYEIIAITWWSRKELIGVSCRRFKEANSNKKLNPSLYIIGEQDFTVSHANARYANPDTEAWQGQQIPANTFIDSCRMLLRLLPAQVVQRDRPVIQAADWYNRMRNSYDIDATPGARALVNENKFRRCIQEMCSGNSILPSVRSMLFGIVYYNWIVKDLTSERQLTGQAVVQKLLQTVEKVNLHTQEIGLAAKDEFNITAERYKTILKHAINKQRFECYNPTDLWEVGGLQVASIVQLLEGVNYETVGWEMLCERYIYRKLARNEGFVMQQMFTMLVLAINSRPITGSDLVAYTNALTIAPYDLHVIALWLRYINTTLVFIDLMRMDMNKPLLQELRQGVPDKYLSCSSKSIYVGNQLVGEDSSERLTRLEEAKSTLYTMSDEQLQQAALEIGTFAMVFELYQTDIGKIDGLGARQDNICQELNAAITNIQNAPVSPPHVMRWLVDRITIEVTNGDRNNMRIMHQQTPIQGWHRIYRQLFRRRTDDDLLEKALGHIWNTRQSNRHMLRTKRIDTYDVWFACKSLELGLFSSITMVYAAVRTNSSNGSIIWNWIDIGILVIITVLMYAITWSGAVRNKFSCLRQSPRRFRIA